MDRLYFTQNKGRGSEPVPVVVGLPDISAESAFEALMERFKAKHPEVSITQGCIHRGSMTMVILPANLAMFNDLEEQLREFEASHPNVKIQQL